MLRQWTTLCLFLCMVVLGVLVSLHIDFHSIITHFVHFHPWKEAFAMGLGCNKNNFLITLLSHMFPVTNGSHLVFCSHETSYITCNVRNPFFLLGAYWLCVW